MRELIAKTARVIGGDVGVAESRAWTVVALMVGAVSVARALPEGDEAERVLDAALQQAVAVIDGAEATKTAG
jgi:TetR/AcrR family transcriptional repressor of nem operon